MAQAQKTEERHRGGLAAKLDLGGVTGKKPAAKPAVDPDKVREISEASGFPSRSAKPAAEAKPKPEAPAAAKPAAKKPETPKPTAPAAAEPSLDRGSFSSAVDPESIEAALARRAGAGQGAAKVQFNTRIDEAHYARLTKIKDFTGRPYGQLVEMAIDLLALKLEESEK